MDAVKVGLLGVGTVGGGTLNVLRRNSEEIFRRAGRAIAIERAVVRDRTKSRICPLEGIQLSDDPLSVVDDPDIQIVAELIGGLEPARTLILRAIAQGKHIVTANKAVIALHGNEIFDSAQERGVMVAFEAAVAGGIPVIKTVREGMAGNRVEWLAGIINGTSNFILSRMCHEGRAFDEVLAEAQQLGYAEADPRFDIDGTDAAHKLTILSAIAFGIPLQFDKVYREGIDRIQPDDVAYARKLGYRIKHLGIARHTGERIELRVHPTLIPERKLLASVDGVMNAVLIKGDAAGPMVLYGAGAGAEPTASAVVADLVDVVRALTADPGNRVPHLAFQPHALSDLSIARMEEVETAYYLRMSALDRPGVLADVTRILGDLEISIEAIRQQEPSGEQTHVPIVILTHSVREQAMNQAIARIQGLASIQGEVMRIRLETLE
ncbi:MAG: homoserine dehydrogenase [Gammaproteobacteria bacterium]